MAENNPVRCFIREALKTDLQGITECAISFFDYAKFNRKGLYLCEKSFQKMVLRYIEDKNGVVLLLMHGNFVAGGIAGMITPWGFNESVKVCQELFFWVNQEYRGRNSLRLFNEFENICRQRGANQIIMLSVPSLIRDGIEKLYAKKDYLPLEHAFIKAIQ